MGVQRQQVLAPGTSLAIPATTDHVDVSDAQQLIFEFLPAGLTGDLEIQLEFCMAPSPSAWAPEPVDDLASATVGGNTMTIPVRRVERTWNENTPLLVAAPCGYAFARAIVSSSDAAGTCGVFINKVANRGG